MNEQKAAGKGTAMMGKINIPQDDCLTGYGTMTYNGVKGHYYRMP